MNRNKLFSFLLVGLFFTLLFTGCGNSASVVNDSQTDIESSMVNDSQTDIENSIDYVTIYDVIEADEPQYHYVSIFNEGLAYAQKEIWGPYGYIDEKGNVIIDFKFDLANCFHEGLASVFIGKSWGYIDKEGNIVIEPVLDYAGDFYNGRARVKINYHEYYIDKDGNILE